MQGMLLLVASIVLGLVLGVLLTFLQRKCSLRGNETMEAMFGADWGERKLGGWCPMTFEAWTLNDVWVYAVGAHCVEVSSNAQDWTSGCASFAAPYASPNSNIALHTNHQY